MTWVIEVDVNDVATGPLHGELLAVVSDAIDAHAPGYATKVRVSWRPDDDSATTTKKD